MGRRNSKLGVDGGYAFDDIFRKLAGVSRRPGQDRGRSQPAVGRNGFRRTLKDEREKSQLSSFPSAQRLWFTGSLARREL